MKIFTFIVVILISTSVSAEQKYYKWTDENGNTHYSSEKPENKKTNEVKVNTNQPKVSRNIEISNEAETESSTEKNYLEKHKEKKQITKKITKQNKSQCQKARQIEKKYQQKVRMGKTDIKTGETVYLEDPKRIEIIQKAKKNINKYCK